ncbi:MAG TPA: 4-hydroxythreonine-4-phosphate dehydrogenase PdxA [Chitinophagales bacterium]|nr:4-hydroxythreonine-4-phosphate dehydrogenase PdxA [Chitinophagales bacterium]HMW12659.1 4-hydroxythreonine-4-phosphate dehydrogenase PdxA [Chitinophagales bacterium]HMX59127.1 4-hydroxythreonine-4-phosphate dehydrogenase PdxA [Chitinophagales bacterium]HMY22777.1 4-hydroxythreonine-4-phosphate dehydrogenase PdxA [Chitinophagales bacterium]HMZ33268.1 4-hydroxythreonine-4-phosphate dehydrogenase PdxA [Chitinophagales bacterium]
MSNQNQKRKVGITLGDVAGIGPEIIIKTFSDELIYKHFTPILYGNPRVLSYYKKMLNIDKFQYSSIKGYGNLSHNSLNIIPVWEEEFQITPGTPTDITGNYALKSLEAACDALKNKQIDVLVTAPINKNVIHSDKFPYAGHTEYLMNYFGAKDNLMFMVADDLRVGLVTNHNAIKDVSSKISKEKIVHKLHLMHTSLMQDFGIDKPRIALLGLNPHAGDGGVIGTEEQTIILPAVQEAKNKGIMAFGPYPADGFFASCNYKKFDAILAMYHDQGLIPFKYIAAEDGTNYTAGLDVVRTSPDHGTAEDIAGKGIADETSFRKAIYTAIDIFNQRANFAEMRENPLVKRAVLHDERI